MTNTKHAPLTPKMLLFRLSYEYHATVCVYCYLVFARKFFSLVCILLFSLGLEIGGCSATGHPLGPVRRFPHDDAG